MRVTVKQPLNFWLDLTASHFSGVQVAGTETNLTEDAASIKRVTEATLVDSAVISWYIVHPDDDETYTASYLSSDEGIATINAEGVLTVVSDGTVRITVTVTRVSDGDFKSNSIDVRVDISEGKSIDYITNANGSAGKAFTDSLGSLISSSDPATAKPRFSSRDLATKTFTRNEDFWAKGLTGLSAISPNNSRSANKRCGTAITKRHIICTCHYPFKAGDTIDFVLNVSGSTTAVTRTIQKVKNHPLYRGSSGGYSYDIQICLLDSDLPSNIDIMEVMPSNSASYYGIHGWMNTSVACFDQEQKCYTKIGRELIDSYYFGQLLPDSTFSTIHLGQSMLRGLSMPGSSFNSPSDYVSTTPLLATDKLYQLNESAVVGDSGSPLCFVLNSKLVLASLFTSGQGGSYLPTYITDINQLIIDVDTLAGIATGYTLTECDLSSYTTY